MVRSKGDETGETCRSWVAAVVEGDTGRRSFRDNDSDTQASSAQMAAMVKDC